MFGQVNSLILRRQPSLPTLLRLLEVQPFPGMEPQSRLFHVLVHSVMAYEKNWAYQKYAKEHIL
jgi:hypothetical protein